MIGPCEHEGNNCKLIRIVSFRQCYKHMTTASRITPTKRIEAQAQADRMLAEIAALSAEQKDAKSIVALSAAFGGLEVKAN